MMSSRPPLLYGMLAYMIAMRWLPYILQNCDVKLDPSTTLYPWSFSPLTAVCLLSGATAKDIRTGVVLPLLALFISDIGIGVLSGHWDWAFPLRSWWLTYGSFAVAVWLGGIIRRRQVKHRLATAMGLGLVFEFGFFVVSNFAIWCMSVAAPSPDDFVQYSFSLRGLFDCFVMALPFFRWSPIGTAFFSLLVFGPLGVSAAEEASDIVREYEPIPVR